MTVNLLELLARADCFLQLALGRPGYRFRSANEFTDFAVVPLRDDMEFDVMDLLHGTVTVVVRDESNRIESQPDDGRESSIPPGR
jgi:hypothetical protein